MPLFIRRLLTGAADLLVALMLWGTYFALYPFPRRRLLGVARRLALVMAAWFRLRVVRKNLRIVRSVAPDCWAARDESALVALAVYHQLATVIDLFKLLGQSSLELGQLVRIEGWETLQAAMAGGRGAVLVSPHYANWELTGAALALRGLPMHAFYYEQLSPALDRFLGWARRRTEMKMLHQRRGLRECLRALKSGGAVGFVADQDGSRDGIFLDFLGRLVSMPRGPYEFARHAGCPVVPISSRRLLDDSYVLVVGAPLFVGSDDGVTAVARSMVEIFEGSIRRDPTQWQLFYDRFWLRHIPRLRELGYLERARAESERDAQMADAPTEEPRGDSFPRTSALGTPRGHRLPGPLLVRLALAFYLPFFLVALGWMAHRHRLGTLLWAPEAAGFGKVFGLAALLALSTVVLSRCFTSRFAWGRAMEEALREAIGEIAPAECVALAVISSLAEETVFRGALQPELGLTTTSVLFGLIHFPVDARLRAWTIFALIMGFCLGALYEWTHGLAAPVLAHFLVNSVNLVWLASGEPQSEYPQSSDC